MNTKFPRHLLTVFVLLAVALHPEARPVKAAPRQQAEADASAIVEQGRFTLYKFEQPIGEETYEIRRDGNSLAVKMDFKFTDRGHAVHTVLHEVSG